jgi:hypothetical protein
MTTRPEDLVPQPGQFKVVKNKDGQIVFKCTRCDQHLKDVTGEVDAMFAFTLHNAMQPHAVTADPLEEMFKL